MRVQFTDDEASMINGGKYKINGNNGKLLFTNDRRVFQLVNCQLFEAINLLNSLMGQSSSDAEYDQKCIAALENLGWIQTIGTY